jgi:hypothetical protein
LGAMTRRSICCLPMWPIPTHAAGYHPSVCPSKSRQYMTHTQYSHRFSNGTAPCRRCSSCKTAFIDGRARGSGLRHSATRDTSADGVPGGHHSSPGGSARDATGGDAGRSSPVTSSAGTRRAWSDSQARTPVLSGRARAAGRGRPSASSHSTTAKAYTSPAGPERPCATSSGAE